MKKIGKKFSFLTKIIMALSLLFSELMPLRYVFAYEKDENLVVSITSDNHLSIKYDIESEYENLDVEITESYKYLDDTYYLIDGETSKKYEYNDVLYSELNNGKEFDFTSLYANNSILFDGTYTVTVKLIDGEEIVALNEFSKEKKFDSGLVLKVFENETEIVPTDGKYEISGNILIEKKVLSGGLAPTWKYTVPEDENEYTGVELIEKSIDSSIDLSGHLYGEHEVPESLTVTRVLDGVKTDYDKTLKLVYGEFEDNTDKLNEITSNLGLDSEYHFFGDSKEGTLYVRPDLSTGEGRKIKDVIDILSNMIEDTVITYEISDGSNLITDETSLVKNNISIKLSCGDLDVTYKIIVFADINSDGVITADDVNELIDKVLKIKDKDLNIDDLYNDRELDFKDVIYLLDYIHGDEDEPQEIGNEEGNLETNLVSSSEKIISDTEFEVNYIVKLNENSINGFLGELEYDKNLFELVSVTNKTDFKYGNNKDGKYFHIGDNPLELNNSEESSEGVEYTLLILKFRALKAGSGDIRVNNSKFINGNNTVQNSRDEEVITINIEASSDNSLKSLKIGNTSVELTEGVYEYEIEIPYATKNGKVEASANHINATVTLPEVNPQEFDVGDNTVTVAVTAENGDVVEYTVKVTRKEASKDATLKTLKIGEDEIELASGTYEYELEIPYATSKAKVAALANDANATVTLPEVNPQEFNVGDNTVTVVVTAENGDILKYTVKVTRKEASSDASLKELIIGDEEILLVGDVYEYELEVDNDITEVDVSALVNDENAIISLPKVIPQQLTVGENKVTISVEAENGNIKEYIVTVIRKEASSDASLKTLKIGDSEILLADGVYDYSIDVTNDVSSVSVDAITNDTGASISSIICPSTLAEGKNEIKVTVIAQDGTEKTYTVIVNKPITETPKKKATTYNTGNNNEVVKKPSSSSSSSSKPSSSSSEIKKEDDGKLSRIIVVILILLVIAGLIYLIFKDDDKEDDETKKANKEIDKVKNDDDKKVSLENSKVKNKSPSNSKKKSPNKKESK